MICLERRENEISQSASFQSTRNNRTKTIEHSMTISVYVRPSLRRSQILRQRFNGLIPLTLRPFVINRCEN
jgi:hypothetical protein